MQSFLTGICYSDNMEHDLRDKVAIITGGAQGLGFAIADAYLQKGAKAVALLDIEEKVASSATAALNTKYGTNKADFFKCDVTSDLQKVFQSIVDKYKNVDILVNSAGIGNEFDPKKTIDINVTALIEWSFKFWEHMRKDKGGKGGTIINLGSIYGCRNYPFAPVYSASKFAVVAFSKSLGHQYNFERSGVRVYVICPGFTHTGLTKQLKVSDEEKVNKDCGDDAKQHQWQDADAVGRAAVETFARADSGTAWLIEGNQPILEV